MMKDFEKIKEFSITLEVDEVNLITKEGYKEYKKQKEYIINKEHLKELLKSDNKDLLVAQLDRILFELISDYSMEDL